MSFEKIFNQYVIPEWRSKYINYEASLGVRKLKAIRLAHQLIPIDPLFIQDRPNRAPSISRLPAEDSLQFVSEESRHLPRRPIHTSSLEPAGLETSTGRRPYKSGSHGLHGFGPAAAQSSNVPHELRHGDNKQGIATDEGDVNNNKQGEKHFSDNGQIETMEQDSNKTGSAGDKAYTAPISYSPATQKLSRTRTFLHRGRTQTFGQLSDFYEKQADYVAWLNSELEKIDSFYGMKETEVLLRFQDLETQFRELERHRAAEDDQQSLAKLRSRVFSKGTRSTHSSDASSQGLLSKVRAQKLFAPQLGRFKLPNLMFGKGKVERVDSSYEMGDTDTSHDPTSPKHAMDPRQDVARWRKSQVKIVEYKTARKQIKRALKEHYRGLELLRQYTSLSRSAFQKLDKKYHQIVIEGFAINFMSSRVSKSLLAQSETVDQQISATEDLYARHFEGGNRKVAAAKLRSRVVKAEDFSWSMARTGILLGSGLVLAIEGLIEGVELYRSDDARLRIATEYVLQLYGAYFLVVLMFLLFCTSCWIWTVNRVNYVFIFGFNPAHCMTYQQRMEIPGLFFFLMGLIMWMNFSIEDEESLLHVHFPTILYGISLLLMFLPIRAIYHKSRLWWAYSNWRLLLPGLYRVEFRDFFLADMYSSLSYFTGSFYMFFCLLGTRWRAPRNCGSARSRAFGFFTCIPSIWRFLQCIRRYYDTKNKFPHLVNALKYLFSVLFLMILSLWRVGSPSNSYKSAFITFAVINSVFSTFWDIFYDWSLGNPRAKHPLLRDVLAFPYPWSYYLAMSLDLILRFNWIFYAIYQEQIQTFSKMNFGIAISEVIRRWIWAVFRIENEHCANITQSRAHNEVVLPYISQRFNESSGNAAHAETAHETLNHAEVLGEDQDAAVSRPLRQHQQHPGLQTDLENQDAHRLARAVDTDRENGPEQPKPLRRSSRQSTLSRMGTIIGRAHTEDFERKRGGGGGSVVGEDEDEESSEEEYDGPGGGYAGSEEEHGDDGDA